MARLPTLELYRTRGGNYRWRLVGANGEKISQGTPVKTARKCWQQVLLTAYYLSAWQGSQTPSRTCRSYGDDVGLAPSHAGGCSPGATDCDGDCADYGYWRKARARVRKALGMAVIG